MQGKKSISKYKTVKGSRLGPCGTARFVQPSTCSGYDRAKCTLLTSYLRKENVKHFACPNHMQYIPFLTVPRVTQRVFELSFSRVYCNGHREHSPK